MTKYIFEKLLRGNLKTFMEEGEIPFYYRIYASYPAKPILKRDYAFYVRCLTEAISLSRLPYYQVKDKLSELEKKVETSEWKHLLGALIMPALNHSQLSQARDNAQLDGLKIVCALKIYKKKNGNYPNNLTALVPDILVELPLDPFTGGNFIYRKEGEGFIVYSLGPNGKDDNGISLKEITKGNNRDNYDIVWKCEE